MINKPLVNKNKIVFPPLHIKLEVMKQLAKAFDNSGERFSHIRSTFPGLSDEKRLRKGDPLD